MLGVDILDEKHVDKILGPKKGKCRPGDTEAKIDEMEAPPAWELEDAPIAQTPMGIKRQGIPASDALYYLLSAKML